MRFLTNHGEKLACVAIVAFCCVWVCGSLHRHRPGWIDPETVRPPMRELPASDPVSYRYHPSQLTPYAEQLRERLERSEEPVTRACAAGTCYPRPERPVVIPVGRRSLSPWPPWPPRVLGGFPVLAGLRAEGRFGDVVLTCRPPEENGRFVPVRIEVQRGPSPDAFEWTMHRFELGGEPRAAKPTEELRYADTDLRPGGTYYYRARLVCRLVAAGVEGEPLYAGSWSSVACATVLEDLQLRYNFISAGQLPGHPDEPQTDCSALFSIRLWDGEARAWGESSFAVAVGKPVKGRLKFRMGTVTQMREFDTGLTLAAVRRAVKVRTDVEREPVIEEREGEDGEIVRVPVLDRLGRPNWVERSRISEIPTEVAILRAPYSSREVRLVKGLRYGEALPPEVKLVVEGEP